jgi:hypothetical protein
MTAIKAQPSSASQNVGATLDLWEPWAEGNRIFIDYVPCDDLWK